MLFFSYLAEIGQECGGGMLVRRELHLPFDMKFSDMYLARLTYGRLCMTLS